MKVNKVTTSTWTFIEIEKYPTEKLKLREEYLPNDVFEKSNDKNLTTTKNSDKVKVSQVEVKNGKKAKKR